MPKRSIWNSITTRIVKKYFQRYVRFMHEMNEGTYETESDRETILIEEKKNRKFFHRHCLLRILSHMNQLWM